MRGLPVYLIVAAVVACGFSSNSALFSKSRLIMQRDVILRRFGEGGEVLWEKRLRRGLENQGIARELLDGRILLSGGCDSCDNVTGNPSRWSVWLDQDGNIETERCTRMVVDSCVGPASSPVKSFFNSYSSRPILEYKNGDLLVRGSRTCEAAQTWMAWLGRKRADDSFVWKQEYTLSDGLNYPNLAYIESARKLRDGGFILAGTVGQSIAADDSNKSHYRIDAILLRTDSTGHELWRNVLTGEDVERLADIVETPDGGFLMCGSSAPFDAATGVHEFEMRRRGWVGYASSDGRLLREKRYGGSDWTEFQALNLTDEGDLQLLEWTSVLADSTSYYRLHRVSNSCDMSDEVNVLDLHGQYGNSVIFAFDSKGNWNAVELRPESRFLQFGRDHTLRSEPLPFISRCWYFELNECRNGWLISGYADSILGKAGSDDLVKPTYTPPK